MSSRFEIAEQSVVLHDGTVMEFKNSVGFDHSKVLIVVKGVNGEKIMELEFMKGGLLTSNTVYMEPEEFERGEPVNEVSKESLKEPARPVEDAKPTEGAPI